MFKMVTHMSVHFTTETVWSRTPSHDITCITRSCCTYYFMYADRCEQNS